MTEIILGIYGVLMIAGAFFGARAGSKISLIAGILSGVFVFIGLGMAQSDPVVGFGFLSALTGLLVVMFFIRLLKTGKFMPSGMLLALSAIAAVFAITAFLNNR